LNWIFLIKRWKVITILIIIIAINGYVLVFHTSENHRGEMCTICGARRHQREIQVVGIRVFSSEKIRDSSITSLREKYIGPCSHDWTLDYASGRTISGWEIGDAFPAFNYPVGRLTNELAAGIRLFEDDQAKIKALEAIGNRDNLLR